MAHGGPRAGSGRKPGSLNKRSQEIVAEATVNGVTPLEFMLKVMRDDAAVWAERLDMAKAAAPYIHPKLSSVEAKVEADVNETIRTIERVIVDPTNPDA